MSRRSLVTGRFLTVLLLSGFVAGCVNRDMNDLERYVDEVKSRKQVVSSRLSVPTIRSESRE